jgi:hypothetical protein
MSFGARKPMNVNKRPKWSHMPDFFKDPNVAKHLSLLHDKYVIVSTDKAPNNTV